METRAPVRIVLGVLGVLCAVAGISLFEGISIELPGIILGGLGYYLGAAAVVLNVISIFVSGLSAPPQ